MGALLHSCVEVRELIELSFGVVSVIGPGIGVLNGVAVLQGEGEWSWQVLGVVQPTHAVGKYVDLSNTYRVIVLVIGLGLG